eukprot:ANDGO_01754.mRNA.1 hypothetical protein AMSG_00837
MKLLADKIGIAAGIRGDVSRIERATISRQEYHETDSFLKCASLRYLDLSHNKFSFLRQLDGILDAPALEELDLSGNPVCRKPDYREHVISRVPTLKMLDKQPVARAGSETTMPSIQANDHVTSSKLPELQMATAGQSATANDVLFSSPGAAADLFANAGIRRRNIKTSSSSSPSPSLSSSSSSNSITEPSPAAAATPAALVRFTESTDIQSRGPLKLALEYLMSTFSPATCFFQGDILWEVQGIVYVVIRVQNGVCEVFSASEPLDAFVMKVSGSLETFEKLLSGSLESMAAIMEGKLFVSDIGMALMFAQAFSISKEGFAAFEARKHLEESENDKSAVPVPVPFDTCPIVLQHPKLRTALQYLVSSFSPLTCYFQGDIVWEVQNVASIIIRVAVGACEILSTPCSAASDVFVLKVSGAMETFEALLSGTLDSMSAIMEGRLSVSDLGMALMFSQAFPVSKEGFAVFEAAKKESERKSLLVPFDESEVVGEHESLLLALEYLASAFSPATAVFQGDIIWEIIDVVFIVIRVENGCCAIFSTETSPSSPFVLKVSGALETFSSLLSGTLDTMAAMMEGRLSLSDLTMGLMFTQAFPVSKEGFAAFADAAKSKIGLRSFEKCNIVARHAKLKHALHYLLTIFSPASCFFQGDILWEVLGVVCVVIRVAEGKCCILTCKNRLDVFVLHVSGTLEVFEALLSGALDSMMAIMQGQLMVSDLGMALMFSQAFPMSKDGYEAFVQNGNKPKVLTAEEKAVEDVRARDEASLEAAFAKLVASWNGSLMPKSALFRVSGGHVPAIIVRTTSESLIVERYSAGREEKTEDGSEFFFVLEASIEVVCRFLTGRTSYSKLFQDGVIRSEDISGMVMFCAAFHWVLEDESDSSDVDKGEMSESERLQEALEFIPTCYTPTNWNGALLFVVLVDGVEAEVASIIVSNADVAVEKCACASPSCTLRIDRPTLLNILDGSVTYMKAFSQGKVKVDQLGELMNFSQAFKFEQERYKAFVAARREGKSAEEIQAAVSNVQARKKSFFEAGMSKMVSAVAQLKSKSKSSQNMTEEPSRKHALTMPVYSSRGRPEDLVGQMDALFAKAPARRPAANPNR